MTRFREIELAKMRLEENRKYRDDMDKWTEVQEKKYQEKLDKLKQKEEELLIMLSKRERVSAHIFTSSLIAGNIKG